MKWFYGPSTELIEGVYGDKLVHNAIPFNNDPLKQQAATDLKTVIHGWLTAAESKVDFHSTAVWVLQLGNGLRLLRTGEGLCQLVVVLGPGSAWASFPFAIMAEDRELAYDVLKMWADTLWNSGSMRWEIAKSWDGEPA